MLYRSGFGVLAVAVVLLLQTQSGEANWFTDLFTSSKAREAHETVYNENPSTANTPQKHKSSWTHELIAAAAGWQAMRAYENHQAKKTGEPVNHSVVKGVLAGLAAAAVDRLIETKGLDWLDAQRAKSRATQQAESLVGEKYGMRLFGSGSGSGSGGGDRVNTPNWQNGVRDADPEALGIGRNPRPDRLDSNRNREETYGEDRYNNRNEGNGNYRNSDRDYRRRDDDEDRGGSVGYSVRDTTYSPDGEYR
ncbi:uncharacterized protein LOC129601516 [Paramacrobiotus metropolitanus]|uniref:uncharacterized protein LOC129601516 n=1 Tax=Paramacrobiotus metropolitanus TaxID=2943436 RepID=UPI00244652AC|nr:uncharacterized protein LOC129601516 [Paramacrobiotus metropolitanus]